MMVEVFVGVGSNIDREHNLRAGIAALRDAFGPLRVSSVWDNPAVGFDGDPFLNAVVGFDTDSGVREVADALDAIEERFGRRRDDKGRYAARTLDLDLLLYGDRVLSGVDVRVPRDGIVDQAFVLCPLAEVAPGVRHPVDGRTFAELWDAFSGDRAVLARADVPV